MPTATTTENHTALATTVLEKLEQAWNAADGAAFGALFAEESDFVNVRGEHHRGSAQIGRGHQGIFDTIYAGSTVRYRLDLGRELAPGVIMAVASATLDVPGGPLQGIHNARFTMVIVEQGDDWRIAAFHNTFVAEGG
ncbi:MAG TPA: SgcJ/EcaC family oxidoreductase [Thermoleophilaceae bacterium]|nr:SgcJ/EcaC family oxidoreductase [Thermoleophilaceae bacterium]